MIYTLTISPAIDYVVYLDQLIPGATNRSCCEEYYFGGKGINVSVVLKNLGVDSVALGFVAGFTGKALEEGVSAMGVRTGFIHLEDGITRINVKVKSGQRAGAAGLGTERDTGTGAARQETEINGQGAVPQEKHLRMLDDKLNELQEGDMLIISGSIPKSLPEDTYDRFLKTAARRGAVPVVDTGSRLLLSTLKYRPFLIKPNRDELRCLFGEDIQPVDGARKLQELGARNVIISLGQDGAVMVSEDGSEYRCGVPPGTVRNTVGSGDSMVAGFIAGYNRTHDYQYALDLGGAAGAATAYSPGLAGREEIEACLAQAII